MSVAQSRMATSLRLRIVVAILVVALAPLLLVFAWSQVDRNVAGRRWGDVRDAMDEAAAALLADAPALPEVIAQVAERRRVRLRVFRDLASESAEVDVDADAPVDALHRFERFFFGAVPTESVREIDASFGPLEARPEVAFAARGTPFVGCQYRAMLFCQAVRVGADRTGRAFAVVAQASSHRAVQPVYLLRSQLLRIALLTLPLAIALAAYASRRIVRPLEDLRAQALDHARRAGRGAALLHRGRDEVGDLAGAFNTLLAALDARRADDARRAADVAHDLKNPVAAIRAAAEQLASPRADAERVARLARVVGEAATRLDMVVTHLLELARAEAGMPEEERSPVDVAALVDGIVASLRDDPRAAGLALTCDVEEERAMLVVGVPHRLESLLRELLDNAVSFAADGGAPAAVRVAARRRDRVIEVTVTDTGPGIREEDLPRVFDRFFTTRGRTRGTGLGLALVKAVAEAHGGAVSARSAEGGGAVFQVDIPAIS